VICLVVVAALLQIDYLLNTGFPERMDVAANKGWRPTGRDFQNICCFLFKQVDSNWTCSAKFEDEVRGGACSRCAGYVRSFSLFMLLPCQHRR
jgi:hypothetical protein